MSPAPQGNLEVEHYIGSCLISAARVPPQANNPAKTQQQNSIITVANRHPNHYHQNFYHPGKPKGNDASGDNRLIRQQGFVNKVQQRPDGHAQGNRYPTIPLPLATAAECNAFPNGGHYIQTARHHHSGGSGSGWAGMPLISMTSGNARRNKNKGGGPPAGHKGGHKNTQFNKSKELDGGGESDCCRSPLSRLAIHTQGAPLIQANRYSNHNRNRNNSYNRGDSQLRLYGGGDVVVRRLDSAKDASKTTSTTVQTKESTTTTNSNSDSLSVASDESSGNSENSLPRIIKPRKRRKKDRKPPPTAVAPSSSSSPSAAVPSSSSPSLSSTLLPSDENLSPLEEKSSVVTLQPYLPLCFESYENPSVELPNDVANETARTRLCNDKQLEDLTASVVDEFPFGNLLDDDEDAKSELSSCAPATLCQCRYCDPSGVIWDVDQRCYSPFLTPPSPTDKIPFSKSLPVFLDPAVQSLRQQAPSYTLNDFGTMLRRSWSDPSSDINMGITRLFGHEPSNLPERSSEAQLHVSSEIVTSPNGHRDIEIKFYSSPRPAVSVPKWPKQEDVILADKLSSASSYVSSLLDYDTNDRLFVAEE